MTIQGEIEDLQRIFRYAVYSRCMMIYLNVKGDVFLLYAGGHYVYFKTNFIVTRNIALNYLTYYNLYQFIKAEKRRSLKQNRAVSLMRIEEEMITVDDHTKIEYTYSSALIKDELFSTTAARLEHLKMFKPTLETPMLRIQKNTILTYYRMFHNKEKKKHRVNYLYPSTNELIIKRERFENEEISFYDGYFLLQHAANEVFVLHDEAIRLIVQPNIPKDAFVYITKGFNYTQVEYDSQPGKFRFFMPNQKEIEL